MYDFALVFSVLHAHCEPPMALTREQIASIAVLARLDLTSSEIPVYQQSLSSILDFVGALDATDTASVAPMAHPLPGLVAAAAPRRGDRNGSPRARTRRTRRRSPRACTSCPRSSSEAPVSDLHRNTLTQLAAGLRARRFSSVELVRAYLERIDGQPGGAERLHLRHPRAGAARRRGGRSRARRRHRRGARRRADRPQGHLLHARGAHHLRLAHAR